MTIKKLLAQDNSKKKVLQYVREPKLSGQLFRDYGNCIAKKYLNVESYDTISDVDKNATYFLDIQKYTFRDFSTNDFKIFREIIDIHEVIKNERAFRYQLTYNEATELIFSCTKFFIEFFKKYQYDILLTHMADSYVIDIMLKVAHYYKIPVISYCANSYDTSYMQITSKGEYNEVRDVDNTEIEKFEKLLTDKFSKKVAVQSKSRIYKFIFKYYFLYKIKYLIHYILYFKLLKSRHYLHLMTKSGTYPRYLKDIFGLKKYFVQKIEDLPRNLVKNKTVYIPLHYHPEATTEYWIHNRDYLTYYPSLFEVIHNYTERGYTVLVKEHTASYMQRDKELYKAILKIPGVHLLSPFITTYQVLNIVEYTVLWTGTTGVEAIMVNEKIILTETETYYSHGKIPYIGNEEKAFVYDEKEKKELATKILSGFLKIQQ